jgi:cytochrome b561
MSIKNTSTTYGSIAKFFHWTIAAIVILMLCFGPFMDDITSKAIRSPVITFHKLTGLAILLLVVLRLLWTLYNPKPQLPINASRW